MTKKIKKPVRAYNAASGLKFAVYVDTSGEYRWNLLAKNGKIIADSAEGYKKESDARAMIALIVGATKFARVLATRPQKVVTLIAPVPVPAPGGGAPGAAPFVDKPFTGNPGPGG
jgi:uncharacterized protein YegP (UPF0339 family)